MDVVLERRGSLLKPVLKRSGSISVVPEDTDTLKRLGSEEGSLGSQQTGKTGKTGKTGGSKMRIHRKSSGSASELASQIRAMTRKSMSAGGGSDSIYSDGYDGQNNDDRRRVRDEVVSVYQKVLGRKPDPAGLSHYTACILDGEMKTRHLIQQLCRSNEFIAAQERDIAQVPMTCREWVNKWYPWNAEPDDADEEVGTVRWVDNPEKENSQRWETGENGGASLEAKVNGSVLTCADVC
jgi:hypothetical protein